LCVSLVHRQARAQRELLHAFFFSFAPYLTGESSLRTLLTPSYL
jgi:hypothetical protein